MPKKLSAGLLLYRKQDGRLEVLLVHPGGPFWAGKDQGVWSIPKGEYTEGEDPLTAAKQEFLEETGCRIDGCFLALTPVKQRSGKVVSAWAVEGNIDAAAVKSNSFLLEWPPRSGQKREFPEVDRAEWFDLADARKKLLPGQLGFLTQLDQLLAGATEGL